MPTELPLGIILGQVKLVDCIKCDEEFKKKCQAENKEIYSESAFDENYAWQLEDLKIFYNPIEAKGSLSLWNYEIKMH